MDLKEVVSIGGVPGLHKIVGQRSNGLIVETLDEQKKRFPTSLNQKVSILEDIAMYTENGEVRLREVLVSLNEKGLAIPDKKADDSTFRSFMEQVLPDYDRERVYTSDIKKLARWYEILKDLLDWNQMKNADGQAESEEGKETSAPKAVAKKPAKNIEKKVVAPKSANVKAPTGTPRKTGGA